MNASARASTCRDRSVEAAPSAKATSATDSAIAGQGRGRRPFPQPGETLAAADRLGQALRQVGACRGDDGEPGEAAQQVAMALVSELVGNDLEHLVGGKSSTRLS